MRQTKCDELVRKALDVFYRNGFHATGMDMLVAQTGVSKTSMYKHFRTKEELIFAVLRLRDELFRNWFCRRLDDLADTPRGQLVAMFDVLKEWFESPEFRGCMFIKAIAEFQNADHPIHVQAAEHKRLLFDHVARIAADAGARDPQGLARQLLVLKEGAIVTATMNDTPTAAQDARAAAQAIVDISCPA